MANQLDIPLILASQSPRRRDLLQQAGYQFVVDPPHETVEAEAPTSGLSPRKLVAELSRCKAERVAEQHAEGLVVAADTVAECAGEVLGKPVDRNDAERMLRHLMATTHRVITGVTLWHRPSNLHQTHVEETTLQMDLVSESRLQQYLDSGDWHGKAGAFGYQDDLDWVHIMHGLESTVVGFPIEYLDDWIQQLFRQLPTDSSP